MGRDERRRALFRRAKARPQSVTFEELLELAVCYGFTHDRTRGSHRQYVREDDPYGMMTFQPDSKDKKMAKRYQVAQLVRFVEEHGLEEA